MLPLLDSETSNGKTDFGDVAADYEVRFTDEAIVRIFSVSMPENIIRDIMRLVTVGMLAAEEGLQDIAWAYATPSIYNIWKNQGAQFTNTFSNLQFDVDPSPFPSTPNSGSVISTGFRFPYWRNSFATKMLSWKPSWGCKRWCNPTKLDPNAFASKMGAFSDSFSLIDKGMQTNAMFSVFDKLIAQTQPPASARGSSLKLISTVQPNPTRTKVFLTMP